MSSSRRLPARDQGLVSQAAQLYQLGLTSYSAAAQMGRNPRTVQRWLGPAVRRRGPRGRVDVPDQRILSLRDGEGLSWSAVAVEAGMSRTGVRSRYLAAKGIPRPGRDRAKQA